MKRSIGFICAALGSELLGNIGTFFTLPSIPTWYAHLMRPPYAPPNWVFGPVWTILFALMGMAAYTVYRRGLQTKDVLLGLSLFTIQFVLNILWSALFFRFHLIGIALIEIALLWIAILATIVVFVRVSKTAAWLMVPYLAWVSFALLLNYGFWQLH